ncbi:MAG: tetratricopeptide repeat protein, partial [Chloroflexales bacterium]|nr:tetratricopeptide repeat protein [Chloroflexales bacterium]
LLAAQGLLAEAIPLWLELGDVPAASRLIPTLAVDLLRSGELHTLLGWLDALPGPVVQTHPDLAAYKAFCLMMLGQLAQARLCLSEAEQAWGAHPSPQSHGRLLAMQALLVVSGGAQGAGELAQAALRELDADDGFFRAFSLMALGYARAWGGSLAEASQVFHEAYRLGQQLQHPFIALGALSNLAATLLDQGRLREAEAHCRAALAAYVDRRGQPLPIVAVVAIRLAAICYERGALDEARGLVTQGMDWCRRIFPTDVLGGDSEVILARIAFQQGNPRRAVALLQEAAQAAGQHQRRTMRYKLVLVQAELQLLQGNLAATVQGLQELETLAPSGLPKADQLVPHLQARYLLATGQPEQALAILERLEETARAAGSTRHLIHIALSQALAHQQCGALEPARQAFAAALRLAIPEGYRTLFVPQPGLSTRPLLQATRSLAPAFVDAILAAAPLEAERAVQLEEPLSDQERRVLTLLVAGKSNQEIAAALLIGVGTAKWHVHNILQKLGARNRAEAIARARALGLPTA